VDLDMTGLSLVLHWIDLLDPFSGSGVRFFGIFFISVMSPTLFARGFPSTDRAVLSFFPGISSPP